MYNLQIYKLTNLQIMKKYIVPQTEIMQFSSEKIMDDPGVYSPNGHQFLSIAAVSEGVATISGAQGA